MIHCFKKCYKPYPRPIFIKSLDDHVGMFFIYLLYFRTHVHFGTSHRNINNVQQIILA